MKLQMKLKGESMANKKWYKVKQNYNNQFSEFYFTSNSLKEAKQKAENHCIRAGTKLVSVKLDRSHDGIYRGYHK